MQGKTPSQELQELQELGVAGFQELQNGEFAA
jgi:hypothetical protein